MSRILIVDDEKENREALQMFLIDENPNWEVFTCDGEVSAKFLMLDQLEKREPIEVILTDLVMSSRQSGMIMLCEAKKLDPLVMVILFTAKEEDLDRFAAFDVGAFDVVEKNIRGKTAAKEILIKTIAALRYRAWGLRIGFLSRYFDPKMFELIERQPQILDVKQRLMTIAFWDIRGFSKLCENLKEYPLLVSNFLQQFSDIAAKTIFEHNGLLDKFIGDGVMSLFGVLAENCDEGNADALDAIQAAKQLRSRFDNLVTDWLPRWKRCTAHSIEIGLGCGIHTGEALAGNMGTSFRDQFTAVGPNVNLASRIEARAQSGEILISQSTAERIKCDVYMEKSGRIDDVKNIHGIFELYSV